MPRIIAVDSLQQFAAINLLSDPGHIGGPIVIPNCSQVVLNWTLAGGKTAHNVLYAASPGVPNPTVALADGLFTSIFGSATFTTLLGGLSSATSAASITVRSVHTAQAPMVQSTATARPGVGSATAMPNETAVVITLRTAKTGQSNRGRMYIPGWSEGTGTAANVLGGTQVTALQAWANTLIAAFTSNALTWVIGQPARSAYVGTSGTSHPARIATSTPITSAVVRNNTWDSQRRRGLK